MNALCLAAALTFSALPDGAPEFLAPEFDLEQVDSTNTPGSADWYLPVERLKLPVAWRITRNGRAVTNSSGRTRIALAPTTGLWPSERWHDLDVRDWYCGYDLADADYVRLPGESAPDPQYFKLASPEMFNLTWQTHVGSTNYHYSALACSNGDYSVSSLYGGTEIFKPRASRFNSVSRSALLGSYEAYYERLYYASQGQLNEWAAEDWGEADDPQKFNFNPTNDLIATTPRFHPSYPEDAFEIDEDGPLRPIPASRRLLDAENIASLVDNVRGLFPPTLDVFAMEDDVVPDVVLDARPFVFRPHWLADPRDYPPGDAFGSRLYWASTIPPPASEQVWWGPQPPVVSTTLGLFPQISVFADIYGLYSEGFLFACYATTLDMLEGGDGFDCSGGSAFNPCFELFDAVIVDCPDAVGPYIWDILPFNPHGMTVPMFLTNAFPTAASSVPNRTDAFDRYVEVGTDTEPVRRMVPGRLDLVNQLLSVMDRTIAIPSMHITSTNTRTKAYNTCTYTGRPVTFNAKWDGADWTFTGDPPGRLYLSGTPVVSTEERREVISGINVEVSETTTDMSGGTGVYSDEGTLSITYDWMADNLDNPSTNAVVSIEASGMGVLLKGAAGVIGFVGIDGAGPYDPISFDLAPSATINREYEWSEAESADRVCVALGPHQPGVDAGGRAVDCKYALLDSLTTKTPDFFPMWRSVLGGYEAGELPGILTSHAEACLGALKGDAPSDRDSPATYIPLPSSAVLLADSLPTARAGHFEITPHYPAGQDVTNTIYYFTLPVPGGTVELGRYDMVETNFLSSVYEWEVHIDHVFDTNWVETTTFTTNYMSDYHGPGTDPSYYYEGEPFVTGETPPDPSEIELSFTNGYPSSVEITGTATTNLAGTVYFANYEKVGNFYRIIESYIYDADHTRDWTVTRTEFEEHDEFRYMEDQPTNATTTVELTVTNSLPEDAHDHRTETIVMRESAELVLVRTDGGSHVYEVFTNPLTGDERRVDAGPPYVVADYKYGLSVDFDWDIEAFIEPDHAAFDESIFFRVMTQVDWQWNHMKLEKEDE